MVAAGVDSQRGNTLDRWQNKGKDFRASAREYAPKARSASPGNGRRGRGPDGTRKQSRRSPRTTRRRQRAPAPAAARGRTVPAPRRQERTPGRKNRNQDRERLFSP